MKILILIFSIATLINDSFVSSNTSVGSTASINGTTSNITTRVITVANNNKTDTYAQMTKAASIPITSNSQLSSTTTNPLNQISSEVQILIRVLMPDLLLNPDYVFSLDRNRKLLIELFDTLPKTIWSKDCLLGMTYYRILENEFLLKRNASVTLNQLMKPIACRSNCDFRRLIEANFTNDWSNFTRAILPEMNPDVVPQCRFSLGGFMGIPNRNATTPLFLNETLQLTNGGVIPPSAIYKPFELQNLSPKDSADLIKQYKSTKTLDFESAQNLGPRVPLNTNFSDVAVAACCIPLDIIRNAGPKDLINNLDNMNKEDIDDNRKSFMAFVVSKSGSKEDVENFLKKGDSNMAKGITLDVINKLSVSMDNIPTTNWPPGYVQNRAQEKLKSSTLNNIDSQEISKILPALTPTDIKNIPSAKKQETIFRIMSASENATKFFTTTQRKSLLSAFLNSVSSITEAKTIFDSLTTDQVESISELLIGANSTLLNELASSKNFGTVISKNSQLPSSKCCSFLKQTRDTYAQAAIKYLISAEGSFDAAYLDRLGTCFASNIPETYLSTLSSGNLYSKLSYFNAIHFQPNSTMLNIISTKLSEKYNTYTTDNERLTFVLEAKGLAVFVKEVESSMSQTYLKNNAKAILNNIASERDVSNEDVQKCRLGTGDDNSVKTLADKLKTKVVTSLLSSSTSRKKRSTTPPTCSDLNDASNALNVITSAQFDSMDINEVKLCLELLGRTSNNFDTSQLSSLATKVKAIYNSNIASIPDSDIQLISNIFRGFSAAELAQLNFNSIGSVEALGLIDLWSVEQASSLISAVKTKLGSITDSVMLSALSNLACGLTESDINSISDNEFKNSIGVLSKMSAPTCNPIKALYAKARIAYSNYTDMQIILTDLGSLAAGISSTEIKTVSSSAMTAFSELALRMLPAEIVNNFSNDQFTALSSDQISSMINSPNSNLYSTSALSALTSISKGLEINNVLPSSGFSINKNFSILIWCNLIVFYIFR